MASSAPAAPPAVGDLLDGHYRLVARIGHGGFGDVWRADELLPGGAPFRQVALKLLVSGGGDVIDWAEEAKLLASFRHPSLITVYAAGILGIEQRFVSMELLEGQNLSEVFRARGPLPWRRVLRWALSAAGALDVIHAAGVVHLDLKPANLFLCEGGALKVLDFGIARRSGVPAVMARRGGAVPRGASTREAELATGLFIADRVAASHEEDAYAATHPIASTSGRQVVIGTPGYMAPEVLELSEPTAAADAYALAVCVVQLVTGHLPHAAPDEPETWDDPTAVSDWLDEIRRATLRGALRSFDEGEARIPRGLAALLRRLLAVEPTRRGLAPGGLAELFNEAWERPYGVPDPPYFARAPYPHEAEGVLFGRDEDIARLGRELEYEPCVVLHGAAGSGKSSLLAAGLLPYLGKHGVDDKDDWRAVPIDLAGAEPDAALGAALATLDPGLEHADVDALAAHCASASVGVVLVLDPLEGVVGGDPPAVRSPRLAALLLAIAGSPARRGLRLVGALGEEGTADLLAALRASPLGGAVRAALRFVGAPATAAVQDLVSAPARYAGVAVTGADVVAADVRRELRAGGGRLPFVALALAEWWRDRGPVRAPASRPKSLPPSPLAMGGAPLQGRRWQETGGVGGAVVRHAERVLGGLDAVQRMLAEEILMRLAATDGAKVRWDREELVAAVAGYHEEDPGGPRTEEADTRAVLAVLARELVVRVEGAAVEIGHEALLGDWPRLAGARLAHMDRLLLVERLREARIAWERADNHRDFLLHGALLEEVNTRAAWLARGLGPADRTFLRESRRRARYRSGQRVALAVFVALTVVGGVAGERVIEESRAREARTRAVAAELEMLAELAARARRSDDPYSRAALVTAALSRGSTDGLLPLDLLATTANLARAQFVTTEHIDTPAFPWDDRFLVGSVSPGTLAVLDFRPPEPDVIDDLALDFDPAQVDSAHFKTPSLHLLRPHDRAVVERVDFAFDTAFATRSSDGEVKVFRLRDDGLPALAAVAPMPCLGPMVIAAAAPVLACGTDHGVARWDLRAALRAPQSAVVINAFQGDVADVSPDGERVAVISGAEVFFWSPTTGGVARYLAPRPVSQVRLSPQGHAAALLEGTQVEIVDDRSTARPLFTVYPSLTESRAARLRWDDGGLDLAVCSGSGGRWYYLRRGGRAKDDPPPRGSACSPPRPHNQPEPVPTADDAPELAEREVGPHLPAGGWKLRNHRYLTRDLTVLDAAAGRVATTLPGLMPPAAARLLRFDALDDIGSDEEVATDDSIAAVERDDGAVMLQIGDEMRFYALPEATRLFSRKGNFLRRCADGRWLSWEAQGESYRIFDAWAGATVRSVPREPGFMVGVSGACRALYTQRLDGTLVEHALDPGDALPPRELPRADSYVFDARALGPRAGAGLLLAFGSGAVGSITDGSHTVQVLGYASPRATAIAPGAHPGEVVFADATGVVLLRPAAPPSYVHQGNGVVEWSDLSVSPDGTSLLLAAPDRLAALDLLRRELLGSIPVPGKERLSRWDDEGSVLLWSFDRKGRPEGVVVPRGVSLAQRVAAAVSNLDVERGRVTIKK